MSLFSNIIEKYLQMTTAIIVIHVRGRVVWASPSVKKLFKINSIGKSVFDFIHPDFAELVKYRVSKIGPNQSLREMEIKWIDSEGRELYIQSSATYVEYCGQEAILGVGTDMTQLRNTEKVLVEAIRGILSDREGEFLDLAARGLSRREIAKEMETTDGTVDTYRNRIKEKLRFDSDKLADLIDYIRIRYFYD